MWSWATQRQLLRHTRMTLRKPKLYLKLVVRIKTTGTYEGWNDTKKIKKSKSSYPVEGRPSSKNVWGRLIYSVSPLPQSFLIRSVFSPPGSLHCTFMRMKDYIRIEKGKV